MPHVLHVALFHCCHIKCICKSNPCIHVYCAHIYIYHRTVYRDMCAHTHDQPRIHPHTQRGSRHAAYVPINKHKLSLTFRLPLPLYPTPLLPLALALALGLALAHKATFGGCLFQTKCDIVYNHIQFYSPNDST